MDFNEIIKRGRRVFDGNFSSRKTILITLAVLALVLYLLPNLLRLMSSQPQPNLNEYTSETLSQRLAAYYFMETEIDGHIAHKPLLEGEKPFAPYVGNGYLALGVMGESPIYIRSSRSLSLPAYYRPVALLSIDGWEVNEAIVTHYRNGVVTRLQHWQLGSNNVDITYQVYAHRLTPSLLIQDIKVTNPTDIDLMVETHQIGVRDWPLANYKIDKLGTEHEFVIISGTLDVPGSSEMVIPVAIISLKVPSTLEVKARQSSTLHVLTVVNYSGSIKTSEYKHIKQEIERDAVKIMLDALKNDSKDLKYQHSQVWQKLWLPGFSISHSKAEKAVNGDLINATIYYVLSQSTAPLHELQTLPEKRNELLKDIAYAEGCYGGQNTLNAERLWSQTLSTVDEINEIVSLWIMTLEKQGCHQMLRTGADGVMDAMLLSFGGLQFKNQHLEFNVDPKHLHRDYHFRRLSYGNATHLNISVMVQEEDYKAVIYCALDRSDRSYYGCDAGCLDPPMQLGPKSISFPVKLTDPLTAILYITSDKVHMEELKHTIHVKEIALAPAHEHHVIALHKHGHKWGGLPTVFWMTIIALIVVFHLFLFKLVVNEYCGPDVKIRYRKLSDF